jgi:Flp pilus assembly protein TadG
MRLVNHFQKFVDALNGRLLGSSCAKRRARPGEKDRRSGQALIMITLMISTLLIPMVGLAVDGGRGYLVRIKLSTAVDGASLAAGRLIGTPAGGTAAQQKQYAQDTALQFLRANFPSGFFGAQLTGTPTICVDPGTDTSDPCHVGNGGTIQTYKIRTIAVSATAQMPTTFMRVLGMNNVTVNAIGTAQRRDVRVILVIDRSVSMVNFFSSNLNDTTKVNGMAWKFVNSFNGANELGGRDEVGLVVFGGSGIVAVPARDISKDYTDYRQFVPPNNQFKTTGNIKNLIADISSGSNTGTAEALYLAQMMIRADADTNSDLSSMLNVIVLFTDGIPNGVTAWGNDPVMKALSTYGKNYMLSNNACSYLTSPTPSASPLVSTAGSNHNMIGWFAQGNGNKNANTSDPHGLKWPMMANAGSGYSGHGDDIDYWMRNADRDASQVVSGNTVGTVPQMAGCANDPMNTGHFPVHDLHGNWIDLNNVPAVNGMTPPKGSTGSLYKEGTLWSTSTQCNKATFSLNTTANACQVGLASWQATAHQAWKIWNQIIWDQSTETNIVDPGQYQPKPIIFTIGFDSGGNDKPDMQLLKIIANDVSSPVSFSSINGQSFYAADPNAADIAFQQIRSEILRLSQ